MSFWLAWWLLIVIGIIIVLFVQIFLPKLGIKFNKYNSQWAKWTLYFIFLIGFYVLSVGLLVGFTEGSQNGGVPFGPAWLGKINDSFFNIIKAFYAPYYELHLEATSTEFVFSSGQEWIRNILGIEFNNISELTQHPTFLFLGIIMFCSYPGLLRLGVWLGELIFGTSLGKKGMWELGWFAFMIILLIVVPIITSLSVQNTIIETLIPGLSSGFNIFLFSLLLDGIIAAVCISDFYLILRKKQ